MWERRRRCTAREAPTGAQEWTLAVRHASSRSTVPFLSPSSVPLSVYPTTPSRTLHVPSLSLPFQTLSRSSRSRSYPVFPLPSSHHDRQHEQREGCATQLHGSTTPAAAGILATRAPAPGPRTAGTGVRPAVRHPTIRNPSGIATSRATAAVLCSAARCRRRGWRWRGRWGRRRCRRWVGVPAHTTDTHDEHVGGSAVPATT